MQAPRDDSGRLAKPYWFKAKSYGWGWTPARWQGWLVIVAYLLAISGFGSTLDTTSPLREIAIPFYLPLAFLTAILLFVCYKTGERPRWRWGEDDPSKE